MAGRDGSWPAPGVDMKDYCFVGYSNHKAIRWNGKWISAHIDSEILSKSDSSHSVFCLGDRVDDEFIPSIYISNKPSVKEILVNFFRSGPIRWRDIRFIIKLYEENEFFRMASPVPPSLAFLWSLRAYVVARHIAYVFRDVAKEHKQARVIVFYSAAMLGVVYAFRRLGKPVYEVQHGYIGPSHNAYNKPELITSDSYFAPTGFVVWDDKTANFLRGEGAREVEVVGFRHLANFSSVQKSEKRVVLITTQHSTPLPDFLGELISSIDHVIWRFRLHPLEQDPREDIRAFLKFANVEISTRDAVLADDLGESLLHITAHSSAVHEAAAMKVVSLFTHEVGKERFSQEIADGLAIFVGAETAMQVARSILQSAVERAAEPPAGA